MDFNLVSQAPHVAPVVHHVAHCTPVVKTVLVGMTYAHAAIAAGVSFVVGYVACWFTKNMVVSGATTVATDVKALEAMVMPSAAVTPVAA